MNAISLIRELAQTNRRRRWAGLVLEAMEERLAPSPTWPMPPPQVASIVADFPHNPDIPNDSGSNANIATNFPHNPG